MGPLEISGTSSAGAQGKTPSCAADSRGAGERTGPAVPAEAQQPALPAHIPTNAGEAPAAHRTGGGGGQELGKILAGGQTPSPQSSPEPPCDGNPATPPGARRRAGPGALQPADGLFTPSAFLLDGKSSSAPPGAAR